MIERPLDGFRPQHFRDGDTSIVLRNDTGIEFKCSFVSPWTLHTTVTGPGLPLPPSRTVRQHAKRALPLRFMTESSSSKLSDQSSVSFSTGSKAPILAKLSWTDTPVIEIFANLIERDSNHFDGAEYSNSSKPIFSDLPFRGYSATEHGVARYTTFDEGCVHLGLGERAAPLDLTKRSFVMAGSDSASYDAYLSDPLYKHTPFLVSVPRPRAEDDAEQPRHAVGILSASNSDAQWDVARFIDEPWKMFKKYTQDWGGLDEYIIVGAGVGDVVARFADLVGYPQLVPRAWLGYLASGMGLGESDDPPAQTLLEQWPAMCQEHGIPCSAMHLSSGYTVDERTGDRMVFTMNKKRYPDFAGMISKFHSAGIAVAPNVKPYVLTSHPGFEALRDADALFRDPKTGQPVITRIWASSIGVNAKGSWIDMTSRAGQDFWRQGVAGLVDAGVDGIWNDNNEYTLHDDAFEAAAELSDDEDDAEHLGGPQSIGILGKMRNTHEMARCSADVLRQKRAKKRPLVLTRSANISTMQHASSSWSGDNRTSWTSLRGSVAMVLNAQLSLLSSYGTDVGGFGGPQPSPELLARWIQMGVTHPRFCIHSYKPTPQDPSGKSTTTLPWMYEETLPAIRALIKRRYEMLPFWNDLQWRSHLRAEPCNTPMFWNQFAGDAKLYPISRRAVQDGNLDGKGSASDDECLDYWIGTGRLLFCGQYFEGASQRKVYLPRTGKADDAVFYNLHKPYNVHSAGSVVEIDTPLDHGGLFAREGTVVPIGKPSVTSTIDLDAEGKTAEASSIYGTATAGKPLLARNGGVVELDDWRGVEIYPEPAASISTRAQPKTYTDTWIEDDGESAEPDQAVITISFTAKVIERPDDAQSSRSDSSAEAETEEGYVLASSHAGKRRPKQVIVVEAAYLKRDFMPLWDETLHIILPRNDKRSVEGGDKLVLDDGRVAWRISVQDKSTFSEQATTLHG